MPSMIPTREGKNKIHVCFVKLIAFYRNIILPFILYGCETWSLTMREECRLRKFNNGVLWRILGLKRNKVSSEWRRLHNEELYDLYSSSTIVRVI
jgi:hypothetical protein